MSNTETRLDRTRTFFRYKTFDLDPATVFLHVTTGACDDDDLGTYEGHNHFTALDMDDMFRAFVAFEQAVSDGLNWFVNHPDCMDTERTIGLFFIEDNGKIDFTPEWDGGRCDFFTEWHYLNEGTALRAIVDCTGACGVELYRQ